MAPDSRLRSVSFQDTSQSEEEVLQEPLLLPATVTVVATSTSPYLSSRNVLVTLAFTWCAFAGRSVWSQSVLATFVYLLKDGKPAEVGYITAVMGISQLITSFPSGFLADSYRRDTVLKGASIVGLVATLVSLLACYQESYIYLTVALALWGCFWGMANTSLSALFADSIPDGLRSKYFTYRSVLVTMGNTTGPLVALIMFVFLGDRWTVHDCAIVIGMGQIISLPAVALLCYVNDDNAVTEPNEEDLTVDGATVDNRDANGSLVLGESLLSMESDYRLGDPNDDCDDDGQPIFCCHPSHNLFIPTLVASGDLLAGLGSGMSIRYFPIFFVDTLKLSPVVVQVLYVLGPLNVAGLMYLGQQLAKRYGRCRVSMVLKWFGVLLMGAMIVSYTRGLPTWFTCAIYVVRTGFINSTSALTRSLLMDNVPKEQRGKWAALESVNMFSWSGSAAVGGVLIDAIGILPLFIATAAMQFLSTLFLIPLIKHDEIEGSTGRTTP